MSYSLNCLKCKIAFISEDEADADGEGFCPVCIEEKKVIAKRVDEQVAMRRVNKQPNISSNVYQEILKKPKGSLTYMNLR